MHKKEVNMNKQTKLHELILNETIKGTITLLIPIIFPSIYSTLVSWNYNIPIISVMFSIPTYIYGILCAPFIYWFVRKYYIHKKMNEGITKNIGLIGTRYVDVGEHKYNDLIWIIQVDEYTFRRSQLPTVNKYQRIIKILDSLVVSSEPKCPYCGAGLHFHKHDLYYSYKCVNPECKFIKRTWESNSKMRDIAKKQFQHYVKMELM